MQLCGRAGRGGSSSRAHLFYSTRQKNVDADIQRFCTEKENCRRKNLILSMGSHEEIHREMACCDICSSIPASLSILPKRCRDVQQKRRTAQRHIDDDLEKQLKDRLLEERDAFMQDHPNYLMIGCDFICSTAMIDDICKNARFITSKESLSTTYDILPDMKDKLYKSIEELLVNAPKPLKKRKTVT